MTDLDLDAIEARANAAGIVLPPNTFAIGGTPKWEQHAAIPILIWLGPVGHSDVITTPNEQVAEFIAHAREDVPALVAEARVALAVRHLLESRWYEHNAVKDPMMAMSVLRSTVFPEPSVSGSGVSRCPHCRHAPHEGVCLNMQSDNDCQCVVHSGSIPSVSGSES
jgi:hypothetical protein